MTDSFPKISTTLIDAVPLTGSSPEPSTNIKTFGLQSNLSRDRLSEIPLEMIDDQVMPIPLPTEIPQPPNLSSLPSHILHSGTVETLIGQNEDLMARLKVNLRRNSLFEQQIIEQERVNSELKRLNGSLVAQLQVLQEKDKVWKEKTAKVESRFENLNSQINLWELRYAEYHRMSQEKIESMSTELTLLQSFQRRSQRWVRPMVDRLKYNLRKERSRIEVCESELSRKDMLIADLRKNLNETITHIQGQQRQFQKDQGLLVEQYENRQKELETQVTQLQLDMQYHQERSGRLDQVSNKQIEAENRAILLERRTQELESRFREDTATLQAQLMQYRSEAKTLAVELCGLQERLTESGTDRDRFRDQALRAQDQLESLQILWSDSCKKVEDIKLKNESLNHLNHELSLKLRDQRRQIENQVTQTKTVTSPFPDLAPSAESGVDRDLLAGAEGRLKKIDSLLAEIQSGFPMARTPDMERVRELKILDDDSTNI